MSENYTLQVNNRPYIAESEEEYAYALWIQQLIEEGYILDAKRPNPILAVPKVEFPFQLKIKRKIEPKKVTISKGGSYTGDMEIIWAEKAHGIFFLRPNDIVTKNISPLSKSGKLYHFHFADGENLSLVDVKGTGQNPKFHSSSSFDRIQQLVYLFCGIPLQKIVPLGKKGLLAKTFVPTKYQYTNGGKLKTPRTWVLKSFKQFIDGFNAIIWKDTVN